MKIVTFQQGISLIEIMLSLLLSSMLIGLLMHHYVLIKRQSQRIQTQLTYENEMQYAIELMQGSIRQAGFTPCLNLNTVLPEQGAFKIEENKIQLNRMHNSFANVVEIMSPAQVKIHSGLKINLNKHWLIVDCYHAEILTITAVESNVNALILTFAHPLHFKYEKPIYVGEWIQESFFIDQHKSALMYHASHTDVLTPVIYRIFFQVERNAQGVLIHGQLNYGEKYLRVFDTWIPGA